MIAANTDHMCRDHMYHMYQHENQGKQVFTQQCNIVIMIDKILSICKTTLTMHLAFATDQEFF